METDIGQETLVMECHIDRGLNILLSRRLAWYRCIDRGMFTFLSSVLSWP